VRLPEPGLARQKSIILGHYYGMLEQFGRSAGVRLARKHLSWYSSGLPGSAEFRARINRLTEVEQVLAALDGFYDPLIERGVSRASTASKPLSGEEVLEAA
jgi:tRNA-dihydrouridine synthase B